LFTITITIFDRAMTEIYAKIYELHIDIIDCFAQEKEQLEDWLKVKADLAHVQVEKNIVDLLQSVYQQIKASQLDLQVQLAALIARLDQIWHIHSDTDSGTTPIQPQLVATLRAPFPLDKGTTSEVYSDFIHHDN
jgi:hypothetical protein